MARKWLWCVAVIAAGAIVWNEYRLHSRREEQAADREQHTSTALNLLTLEDELAAQQGYDRPARGGEEESEVTVIDLTWLQRQTIEPPAADTEEPAAFPQPSNATEHRPLKRDLEIPVQFRAHSADGDDCCEMKAKLAGMWQKLVGWISAHDGAEESEPRNPLIEQLYVLPRPLIQPQHCPETSVCPYLNGASGQHYRR